MLRKGTEKSYFGTGESAGAVVVVAISNGSLLSEVLFSLLTTVQSGSEEFFDSAFVLSLPGLFCS